MRSEKQHNADRFTWTVRVGDHTEWLIGFKVPKNTDSVQEHHTSVSLTQKLMIPEADETKNKVS